MRRGARGALALAADLGHAEQQVLGRDVLVAEATRLLLARSMTRFARGSSVSEPPWIRARRARIAGQLAAERRQVDAEPAERLGRDAVVRLEERGEEVLGVEDRALEPLGELLGGDDGLLGLLGEAVELHVGSPRSGQALGARGSGWSTRSRNRCAAAFASSSGRSAGRPGPSRRGRRAVALEPRACPGPCSRKVRPFWVPAGS